MYHKNILRYLICAALVFAFFLSIPAGCGSSKDEESETPTETPAVTPTATVEPDTVETEAPDGGNEENQDNGKGDNKMENQGNGSIVSISSYADAIKGMNNIALYKAAYHSSAADYNETGHLVTDGIKYAEERPNAPSIQAEFNNHPAGEEADKLFDKSPQTKMLMRNTRGWVQVELMDEPAVLTKYSVCSANDDHGRDPKNWVIEGSNDGISYVEVDKRENVLFPGRYTYLDFEVDNSTLYSFYRFNVTQNTGGELLQFAEWVLYDGDGNDLVKTGTSGFSSRWTSAGSGEEWVYVDFGTTKPFSKALLLWGQTQYPSLYKLQISEDCRNWENIAEKRDSAGGEDFFEFDEVSARYLRVLAVESAGDRYELIELEVYNAEQITKPAVAEAVINADGTQSLTGDWTLQRASEVSVNGEQLSLEYDDSMWVPAVVPGTVLSAFRKNGGVPDANYADYQRQISDSYFTADFWYRNTFTVPEYQEGRTVWLNFNSINWKADVFVNGKKVGRIEGAFIRGRFDITDVVKYDGENHVAVYIIVNDNPGQVREKTMQETGPNGGVLGADNPTIHPSVGWDWVPVIRGRNTGIYGGVYLSYTDGICIDDPYITTEIDMETGAATATLRAEARTYADKKGIAVVLGVINPGGIYFEKEVEVAPGEITDVTITDIVIPDAQLWWPSGYGEQFLYTASVSITSINEESPSDTEEFNFGVREITYVEKPVLEIYVNGTRIFCRGGNWGMDDSNLEATPEDYDIKVRLHAEENFTMIRNWVGQTNNDAFYEACDKYGVLVWDDFWLANPGDGPNPDDEGMFLENAADKLKRVRKHPSVALYCGRNEGDPPATLNAALKQLVEKYDGGKLYIPHSAAGTVSGFGPYSVQNPRYYFENAPVTLHSERGMPNIPTIESIKRMLPEENLWPIDEMWALHDFTMGSAQNGNSFLEAARKYGNYDSLESFSRAAQMVNYENHKAMFEGMAVRKSNGLLMWMSQSAWPSMVWQTYDYYYDTNGAYFGIKTANQPVNPIWNTTNGKVILTNHTPNNLENITVNAYIFNIDGKLEKTVNGTVNVASASTAEVFACAPDGSGVSFIRTVAVDADGNELGRNFYWTNPNSYQNYAALGNMPYTEVEGGVTEVSRNDGVMVSEAVITNDSGIPAIMIHVKTFRDTDGNQVLPVYYEDNYFSLMPGESKTIKLEFDIKLLDGGKPVFKVDGFNVDECELSY